MRYECIDRYILMVKVLLDSQQKSCMVEHFVKVILLSKTSWQLR